MRDSTVAEEGSVWPGFGEVVTYLPVTENRVEVELSCTGSGQFDLDLDLRDGETIGVEPIALDGNRISTISVSAVA